MIKKLDVVVLDMDFQKTILTEWSNTKPLYKNAPPYEVLDVDLENSATVMKQIANVNGHVIIDLPGRMDDDNLVPVFQNADLVICPTAYDKKTFESTIIFAKVVRHLNTQVPLVFLPNRIKANVIYQAKDHVHSELSVFGIIAPGVSDKISFQRADTMTIPKDIQSQVSTSYDFIYQKFIENL